jgi:murein DD-endopeptidase MepM/ murein hydrolase activator NlpD
MEAVYVKRGESVRHGVMIGRVGATGKVAEAQLHFQLRQGKQPVDPAPFLPKMTVSAAG